MIIDFTIEDLLLDSYLQKNFHTPFLKDKLTGSARRTLDIINEIVIIIFSGTILVYGGIVITTMNMLQYDSILKIPTGTVYSIIPVCGVLIIFYSLYNLREIFTKKEGGV